VKTEKGNLMTVQDARFGKTDDDGVPGPGTYTVRITVHSVSAFSVHGCL